MPPDLALLSTLIGSNYPCLELIFMVPKVFEPLKFDCILKYGPFTSTFGARSLSSISYKQKKKKSRVFRTYEHPKRCISIRNDALKSRFIRKKT